MELRQLEYIVTIADEQSIAKASQKLFITQSALNQQLLKLERELGVPLFNRIKEGLVPTHAGEVYLDAARKMLLMKAETYRYIQDIADMKKGEISIAYTPEQGSLMFSHIYPIFHKMYPDITFRIVEARVKQAEQLLSAGKVNIALTSYASGGKKPQFDYTDIGAELLVFGVPKSDPLSKLADEQSYIRFPKIDIHLLQDKPLIMLTKDTRFRNMLDSLFSEAGFKPRILFESINTNTVFNMVKSQVAPAFFPQSYVDPKAPVSYFSVGEELRWMRSIIIRRGSYISKAEKDFIELARDYVQSLPGGSKYDPES